MTKHSEGPFTYVRYGRTKFLILDQHHRQGIAEVDAGGVGPDLEEGEANARLFTAAPDLLSACQYFLVHLSRKHDKACRVCAAMRDAIAKAEGRS